MDNEIHYTPQQIDAAYINILTDLVNACRKYRVDINEVHHFQGGFHVTFKGHEGADAICHDYSYKSPYFFGMYGTTHKNDWNIFPMYWETIGFPWDEDDVSTLTTDELVQFIAKLNSGDYTDEDWD